MRTFMYDCSRQCPISKDVFFYHSTFSAQYCAQKIVTIYPQEVLGSIVFNIFAYLQWCPWLEIKIKPLRAIILDHTLDYKFSGINSDVTSISIFEEVRDHIFGKPILQ